LLWLLCILFGRTYYLRRYIELSLGNLFMDAGTIGILFAAAVVFVGMSYGTYQILSISDD